MKDFPTDFINELSTQAVTPIQVLVFHFESGTRYISDREVQFQSQVTESLVTDWGTIHATANVDDTARGDALHCSSVSVSITNVGPNWLSKDFITKNPTGTIVEFWQILEGVNTPQLLNKYIIQDTISFSQGLLSITLDLISIKLQTDPYVGTLDPVNNTYSDVLIGPFSEVVGSLYGVNPVAKVNVAYSAGTTSIVTDRDLSTAGFPSSGSIEIGVDVITYTGITGVTFTGCSGVDVGSSTGQFVTKVGHDYVFEFGVGPVDSAGPVYVNGEVYTGSYTINKNNNPVLVTFPDRLPNIVTDIDATYTHHVNSIVKDKDDLIIDADATITSGGYIYSTIDKWWYGTIPLATLPTFNLTGIPTSGLYNWEAYGEIKVHPENNDFDGDGSVEYYFGGDVHYISNVDDVVTQRVTGLTYSDVVSGSNRMYYHSNVSFLDAGEGVGTFYYMELHAEWDEIDTPGYQERESFDNPSLAIGDPSSTGVNPADAILSMLSYNPNIELDNNSFNVARQWYTDNNYVFNGFVPGNQRMLKTIIDMCQQCRSVLVGYPLSLKVLPDSLSDHDMIFFSETSDDVVENSVSVRSPLFKDVVNAIDVRYNAVTTPGVFDSSFTVKNDQSISEIGKQDDTLDLYLVDQLTHAQSVSNFWLNKRSVMKYMVTFTVGTKGLPVEIGDNVILVTEYSGIGFIIGEVINVQREMTSEFDGTSITILGIPQGEAVQVSGHGITPYGIIPHGI